MGMAGSHLRRQAETAPSSSIYFDFRSAYISGVIPEVGLTIGLQDISLLIQGLRHEQVLQDVPITVAINGRYCAEVEYSSDNGIASELLITVLLPAKRTGQRTLLRCSLFASLLRLECFFLNETQKFSLIRPRIMSCSIAAFLLEVASLGSSGSQ